MSDGVGQQISVGSEQAVSIGLRTLKSEVEKDAQNSLPVACIIFVGNTMSARQEKYFSQTPAVCPTRDDTTI